MLFFLKKDKPDRVVTSGGGHMTGYTRPREGAQQGKLDAFEATWTGDGSYETLYPANAAVEPTSVARAQGNVHAVSEDADVNASAIEVYIGPGAKTATSEAQRLEVRRAVASGNARAKMFMPEGNYYRYARGDSLEWDRLQGRMVIMSKAGDAVVWDNSNEWTGRRLVVNRTEAGVLEAESTSGRRIVFYEEGAPKVPSEDAREWKPIY